MKRLAILAILAIASMTTGCASMRSCSGRITTDNGHVIRNEEDCVWGNKYSQPQSRTVYVMQQPSNAPQYVVAPPVVVYPQPPPVFQRFSINVGAGFNRNGHRGRR